MVQGNHTTRFRKQGLHRYVKHFLFFLFFFFFSFHLSATHIVGGIITYQYVNDSTYIITLKLYRDCCPTCANLPASVSIQVQQPDGSEFVPSKDFTIPLGSFTNIPPNLDSCAIPPNPMPCVQEAIYSATVTNLPPNPGGYHIYSQYCCRNLSTTNADMSCNCIGESFYAFIPGTTPVWIEYFNLANGITSDNDTTAWSSSTGAPPPAVVSVNNNLFRTTGADNGQATWTSEYIDISSFPFGVDVKVDLSESGTMDADDTIRIYYRINNGPLILFSYNGFIAGNFGNAMASDSGLTGDSIQIIVQFDYGTISPNTEIYMIDNVTVAEDDFQTNNDPVFNSFPPLFLCVGENFTIDHSATDTDGDSLAYSFYNPFTDDPPAYSGTQAIFTPITWIPGYSAGSPLNAGGPALTLNPLTGLLSGVANTLGQYIVGIKVTEYRNGVPISETIRDFQFNIAFCGFPGDANIDTTGDLYVCNGYLYTFPNQSDSSANNWWWDFGNTASTSDTSILEFPTYTYPDTGDYYVTLITNKGTICADTAYDTVHVSWVVANFSSDSITCAGDTMNFTDMSTVSANDLITGWNWDFGDSQSSSSQNPVHIFTDSGTYTVTLVVSSVLGCTDTATAAIVVDFAPVFIVNMTGNPDSVWLSPSVKRGCQVCGANSPEVCVTFILTLDSGTQMISFNIESGAIPPGALYYEISCANPTEVGDSICINGVGPHQLTFCKPGNNANVYSITAIPKPSAGTNIVVTDACVDTLVANGYNEWTINWTSVYPGATGFYDIYLNCTTGCDSTIVTAQPGYPLYIDYRVCGSPVGGCYTDTVCDTARVYFITSLFVDILPQNPTICFGGSNTTITATPSGGAPPYSYQWNTGETTPSIIVGVGTYFVTVVDSTSCPPVYDTVTVTAFLSPITANAGPDQLVCATNPVSLSGSVTAASGGTWSGGGGTFSPSADSLNTDYSPTPAEIAGGSVTLYLTTTGNGSCPADTDTVNISFYSLTSLSLSSTPVSCAGGADGTIIAFPVGGNPPINYQWDDPLSQTTQTATGLTADTFTVTVSDADNCSITATETITEPDTIIIATSVNNVTCFALCNGVATAAITGGVAPYSFLWSNGNTNSNISNLCEGIYTVTVTDSNGCTMTAVANVTQPPVAVSVSTFVTNISCTGLCDGSISASGSGGTGAYTFDWSNGMSGVAINNLCPDNYTVTITDSNGCSNTMVSTITQPAPLSINISVVNLNCYGLCTGSAGVTASGGTLPYSYLWSNAESTNVIFSLCAINFTVTVTDSNACTITDSVLLTQPLQPINMVLSISNVKCNSANDGYASVTPSGGTPPYTYQWDAAAGSQTDSVATGLYAGSYSVTVFDNLLCTIDTLVTLTQPATALSMFTDSTEVTCYGGNDGTATVNVSGGKPPYSYQWDSAAGSQTTATATGLVVGIYFITITDSCGCRVDSISVTITSIPEIVLNFSYDSVSCSGGSDGVAVALPSGGTPPFTYQWDTAAGLQTDSAATGLPAGVYAITVTDNSNCAKEYLSVTVTEPPALLLTAVTDSAACYGGADGTAFMITSGGTPPYTWLWNTGAGTQGIVSLPAGIYSVTVTDNNGCANTSSAMVNQPASALNDSLIVQNINCKGDSTGMVEIFITGGIPPYSYLWNNGVDTQGLAYLQSGNYSVTVTDKNNCTLDTTVILTEPAQALSYSAWITAVNCYGGNTGQINLVPAGGIPPYTFLWDSSASSQTTSLATGLSSGNYSVTLTDSNNCAKNALIFMPQPADSLIASVMVTDDSCFGAANGTATLNVTGGIPPYTYQWDTNASSQTVSVATGLPAGVYYASVADNFNCTLDSIIAVISEPPKISLNMSSTNVSCKGDSSGTATVSVTGGTPPYSYQWSNLTGFPNLLGLSAGNYSVIVTDTNGCVDTANVTITEPSDSLAVAVSVTDLFCYNDSSGTATVTPSGGTPPYSYLWNNGVETQGLAFLPSGNYSVTVTDTLGCSISDTNIILTQPTEIIVIASGADTVCPGTPVVIGASASGGSGGGYTYIWSEGASTGQSQQVAPAANTGYPVTATDSTGCVSRPDTVTVSIRNLYFDSLDVVSSGNVCYASNDTVTIYGTYKEEFPPYTYTWNQGFGSGLGPFDEVPLDTTIYIMTVTDMCGNSISDSITVFVFPLPVINLPPLAGEGCMPLAVNFADTLNTNATYLWKFGDGSTSSSQNPVHIYTSSGTFIISLIINSVYNCTVTDDTASSVVVHPLPQPVCSAEPPERDINHPGINFTVTAAASYRWLFGDGDSSVLQNPLHSYRDTGNYPVTVDVANEFGCLNSCTLLVRITPVWEIQVPNVFIPDAGGPNGGYYSYANIRNDIFFPLARYVKEYHMMVFNRWGELVFETFDIKQGWDGYYRGKLCQQDVYVWKIYAVFADDDNTVVNKAGDLTLLR